MPHDTPSPAWVESLRRMLLCAFVALASTATASESDDVARAKTHFQAGKTHYELGRYSEAIREFAAGYALSPRPEFLINLGQAYRASGDRASAVEMYERYLEKAPGTAKAREQVQQIVDTLRSELAAEKAKPPPADAPVKDAPVQLTPAPTPVPSEPSPAVAPEPRSAARIVVPIVIGAAVVIGGAIATAVILGNAPSCRNPPELGCLDLRK